MRYKEFMEILKKKKIVHCLMYIGHNLKSTTTTTTKINAIVTLSFLPNPDVTCRSPADATKSCATVSEAVSQAIIFLISFFHSHSDSAVNSLHFCGWNVLYHSHAHSLFTALYLSLLCVSCAL